MARVSLACCCCAALAGCLGVPAPFAKPPPPVPLHTILLFEPVEAEREALRQVVLRHIPLGTPLDQAREILGQQGFICRPDSYGATDLIPRGISLPPEVRQRLLAARLRCLGEDKSSLSIFEIHQHLFAARNRLSVYCHTTRQNLQEWHLQSYDVLVVLIPGDGEKVEDVEVGLGGKRHPNAEFFQRRPELQEPVGMPVAEAQARMELAGFRFTASEPDHSDKGTRPHLFCQAYDENLLGGQIVRVNLYPDESGLIRGAKVLDRGEWFDAEQCILPHGEESASRAVCKATLFPVRVGCRYVLYSVAFLMAHQRDALRTSLELTEKTL